jgi:hypothetical protein
MQAVALGQRGVVAIPSLLIRELGKQKCLPDLRIFAFYTFSAGYYMSLYPFFGYKNECKIFTKFVFNFLVS